MINLTSHVRLKFTGTDRVRYLNGQVTNDIRKLSPTAVQWACVTNHKGKLEALVSLHLGPDDAIYLDGPANLRDFLPLRLEKYIIADDVTLEDVSDTTAQVHFMGELPALPENCRALAASRFGVPGWDVWGPAESLAGLELLAPNTAAAAELSRIDHGVPGWETELNRDILPPEAGLQDWTVDYHKGCYIGQEVISRLKSVGKVNRQLQRLISVSGPNPEVGWQIFPENAPEEGEMKPCGEITSCIWHPLLEKSVALGYVRREHITAGRRFATGPDAHCLNSRIEIRNT